MSAEIGWLEIREKVISILKNAPRFDSKVDKTCYLTSYQIAVLLYRDYEDIINRSIIHKNIGGKNEGSSNSLSQYISGNLAKDCANGTLLEVEMRYFCIEGLSSFNFIDENGIEKEPSNKCISMFRYLRA